ncbi:hypothetical protein [Leifsonia sp. P73]|uniref:hypothetical protein n=1 Tax=Leifsonia sp. P73 TaxID=3423959 RepID=UPI003DA22E2D
MPSRQPRAALENAAAQEAEAGASDTAAKASSNAASSAMQGMQGQTYAILAVGALIGPMTAAVVGLGGAFVAEGAAGILAVRGIKEEMTAGTAVGMQYTAGLAQLKTDLDVLESTAARGILDGFEKAVDRVDSKMPFLNGFVNEFAGILGQSGTNLLDGAISGMETLEPLFREGAGILQEWTAEFASWTAAGGLNDFVSYAEENLPRVAVAFGSLTSAAVTLGNELGPISTDLLDIVTAASDLIGMLNGVNQWLDSIGKSVPILGWLTKTVGDVLNPIQGLSDTIGQLQPQIDQWTGATNLQSSALVAANSSIDAASSATDTLAGAQGAAKTATDQFAQALAGLGNAALSESQANVAWNQSIADATAALQKNGATLDENTQKGRDNRSALDQVASSAIALISAHAKAGVSAQELTGDMAAARQKFIDTAKAMGDTDAQAGALADAYHLIPADVSTQYQATGMAAANQQLGDLAKAIAAIPTSITIGAHVQVDTQGLPTAGHLAMFSTGGVVAQYRAAGGAIDTAYLAGGGNPFQPRGTDTVAAMLTPGEFVVKERSASYDPGFIRAYNDNPAAAIAAKQRGAGGGVTVIISPKGGVDLTKYIDVRVEQGLHQAFGTLAQELNGGLVY